jgi:hypothetical protein
MEPACSIANNANNGRKISKSPLIHRFIVFAKHRSALFYSRSRLMVEQMCKPLPHVAWFVEMTGDTVRAAAD